MDNNVAAAELHTSVRNRTGIIELTRPKALNSLTEAMVDGIAHALHSWSTDPAVEQVLVISASPKAFCAGGDVRAAREAILAGKHAQVDAFFEREYDLNAYISRYPKPYISVIDGIVMGGGLGISAHGSHRIVTPNAFASMPEMAIGYVTDVGIAYMSQNMVGTLGRPSPAIAKFWAITGYRMYAGDMLLTGLATHCVDNAAAFTADVIELGISAALDHHALAGADIPAAQLDAELIADIERAFAHSTWPEILRACSTRLRALVDELTAKAGPTAIVAALALFDYEGKASTIEQALVGERKLCAWLRRHRDFAEGVRAVLVDKTQDPRFVPASVEDVDAQEIARVLAN